MPISDELAVWFIKAQDILSANRITVDGYRYTVPSLDNQDFGRKDYANQFMWDSCFHAIAWRWIDPQMARDELIALTARQVQEGPDAGMIPHCNYWRGGGAWLWNTDERSAITQPPLIAVAAMLVYPHSRDSHDRAFLETIYSRVLAYHDWFDRRRDPDGDHLVALIHPWECGGDALPRWDGPMGIEHFTHENGRHARHELAKVIMDHQTDVSALTEIGSFVVETMEYNAIRVADFEALAEIAELLDKADEAVALRQRAEAVRDAFRAKMVFDGLPYDLNGAAETPIRTDSAAQFMTLFGGCPTEEQAAGLVERLRESRFWTAYPVTTTPTDSPAFAPDVYWRGNVWPCVNWLIFSGLRRYGYHDLARELAERSFELIQQSGFWEYYHPITGEGLGGGTFSWAAVMLDMMAQVEDAG